MQMKTVHVVSPFMPCLKSLHDSLFAVYSSVTSLYCPYYASFVIELWKDTKFFWFLVILKWDGYSHQFTFGVFFSLVLSTIILRLSLCSTSSRIIIRITRNCSSQWFTTPAVWSSGDVQVLLWSSVVFNLPRAAVLWYSSSCPGDTNHKIVLLLSHDYFSYCDTQLPKELQLTGWELLP